MELQASFYNIDGSGSNSIDICKARIGCLGGAVVGCRTRDQKVAGSTPGRDAIKSTRSSQPSIPPG